MADKANPGTGQGALHSEPPRWAVVDVVRTLSIAAVLAIHSFYAYLTAQPAQAQAMLASTWSVFAKNGMYGVTMFFVVSGFLITRTTMEREPDFFRLSTRDFYIRRIGRIVPLLLLVIVWGAFVLRTNPTLTQALVFCFRDPNAIFDSLFWTSLFTFSFNWLRIFHEDTAQGFGLHWDVLWSLAIEEQFYLMFPLLVRLSGKASRLYVFLLGCIVIGPLARAYFLHTYPGSQLAVIASVSAFDLLAMGAILALSFDRWSAALARQPWMSRLLFFTGLFGGILVYGHRPFLEARIYGPTLIGLSVCLVILGGLNWKDLKFPAMNGLAWVGRYSYGMYLGHGTVLFFLWPMFERLPILAACGLFFLVTLGLAYILFHHFEAPMNHWIRNRITR